MDDYEDGGYVDLERFARELERWFSVHFSTHDARFTGGVCRRPDVPCTGSILSIPAPFFPLRFEVTWRGRETDHPVVPNRRIRLQELEPTQLRPEIDDEALARREPDIDLVFMVEAALAHGVAQADPNPVRAGGDVESLVDRGRPVAGEAGRGERRVVDTFARRSPARRRRERARAGNRRPSACSRRARRAPPGSGCGRARDVRRRG